MYLGTDPEYALGEMKRRQAEVREEVREAGLARRSVRASRGRLSSFRIWRLHVMVWFEGPKEA